MVFGLEELEDTEGFMNFVSEGFSVDSIFSLSILTSSAS